MLDRFRNLSNRIWDLMGKKKSYRSCQNTSGQRGIEVSISLFFWSTPTQNGIPFLFTQYIQNTIMVLSLKPTPLPVFPRLNYTALPGCSWQKPITGTSHTFFHNFLQSISKSCLFLLLIISQMYHFISINTDTSLVQITTNF